MALKELAYDELYEMAQDAKLDGRSTMSKEELVAALAEDDVGPAEPKESSSAAAGGVVAGLLTCRVCGAMNAVTATTGELLEFACGECGAKNGPYAVVEAK